MQGSIKLDESKLLIGTQKLDGRVRHEIFDSIEEQIWNSSDPVERIKGALGAFVDEEKLQVSSEVSAAYSFGCVNGLLEDFDYDVWSDLFPSYADARFVAHINRGDGNDYLICCPKNLADIKRDLSRFRSALLYAAERSPDEEYAEAAAETVPLIEFPEREGLIYFYELRIC